MKAGKTLKGDIVYWDKWGNPIAVYEHDATGGPEIVCFDATYYGLTGEEAKELHRQMPVSRPIEESDLLDHEQFIDLSDDGLL